MKYYLKEIDKMINLDDDLVKEYTKYCELRDSMFLIPIYIKYGDDLSKEPLFDKDLSQLCNDTIWGELQVMATLPKFLNHLESHYKEWTDGQMHDLPFDEMSI